MMAIHLDEMASKRMAQLPASELCRICHNILARHTMHQLLECEAAFNAEPERQRLMDKLRMTNA
jgi:hypothetical protein